MPDISAVALCRGEHCVENASWPNPRIVDSVKYRQSTSIQHRYKINNRFDLDGCIIEGMVWE